MKLKFDLGILYRIHLRHVDKFYNFEQYYFFKDLELDARKIGIIPKGSFGKLTSKFANDNIFVTFAQQLSLQSTILKTRVRL